ncbi:hypothetical protein RRG08_000171 [Elysia crispata]|uniref:Uncharacterized protein n=1 Tax=Elysia crispata TaxID=231223 RepID=A0AAE0YVI6_9GAST|nr:hypothetical protein RRG08_000171 [Elysia crispata]
MLHFSEKGLRGCISIRQNYCAVIGEWKYKDSSVDPSRPEVKLKGESIVKNIIHCLFNRVRQSSSTLLSYGSGNIAAATATVSDEPRSPASG